MRSLRRDSMHLGWLVWPLLFLGTMLGSRPARAVYECGGVQDTCNCGRDNFCICCSDSAHGDNHGNCVWYAWEEACCHWGRALEWCTNANTWDSYATSNGYPLCDDPKQNVIFQCENYTSECGSGGYGHVGWVETAYADGSIDVTEEGCYSWYGVRSRHIDAQNASPPMHYIYDKGDSCGQVCECNPGEQETNDCPKCGTETRTCGSDCQWGSWSACENQGPCEVGDTDQQGCPQCGTQTRTCGSDCQWGAWSTCENQGECEAGATESCGNCGGTRTCQGDCSWGPCQEVCPDAGPRPDASTADGSISPSDAAQTTDAMQAGDAAQLGDGASNADAASAVDAGRSRAPSSIRGGCDCATSGGPGSIWWLGLFVVLAVLRRKRRPGGSSRVQTAKRV